MINTENYKINHSYIKECLDKRKYELVFEEINEFAKLNSNLNPQNCSLEIDNILKAYINECYRCTNTNDELIKTLKLLYELIRSKDAFLENKILNRIEFLENKTILESKPSCLFVTLTEKCNLNCLMCYNKDSWEIPENMVEDIIGLFPYLENVEWIGGEVFLYKSFEKLLDNASSFAHLKQGITTNGLLLDAKWINKLIGSRAQITFSVDSVIKEKYETLRRGASFEKLTKNLELFRNSMENRSTAAGRPVVRMNFIVMKSNYTEIENVFDFAHRYGIQTVDFTKLLNYNYDFFRKENIDNDIEIRKHIREIFKKVEAKSEECGVKYTIRFSVEDGVEQLKRHSTPRQKNGAGRTICRIPWQSIEVTKEFARPFCSCWDKTNDIAGKSLLSLWNDEKMQHYRKKSLENDDESFCSSVCIDRLIRQEKLFE